MGKDPRKSDAWGIQARYEDAAGTMQGGFPKGRLLTFRPPWDNLPLLLVPGSRSL